MIQVDWRTDYDAARAEARGAGRLILLHFFLADRPLCKAMDEETFAHAEVTRALRERYVCVRADVDAQPQLFESTIGGRGGLAGCVVDADGDVVSALHGYAGPQAYLLFLRKAQDAYGRLKSAREEADKDREDLAKLYALGEAYRAAGSLRRADECYRAVVERPAKDAASVRAAAASHERLARFRVNRGKNLDARKHLAEARRLDPAPRAGWTDRLLLTEGLILAIERKHLEAVAVLKDAVSRFPSSEEADHLHFALGFVLHQAGQDKPALEVFEAATKRYPESSWLPAIREQIEHIKNPQPDHVH